MARPISQIILQQYKLHYPIHGMWGGRMTSCVTVPTKNPNLSQLTLTFFGKHNIVKVVRIREKS